MQAHSKEQQRSARNVKIWSDLSSYRKQKTELLRFSKIESRTILNFLMPLGKLASFWIVRNCSCYSNCLPYLNRKISEVLQEMRHFLKIKGHVLSFSGQLPEEESQNSQHPDNSLLSFDQNPNSFDNDNKSNNKKARSSGVYVIRNTTSGAVYVGEYNKRKGAAARFAEHRSRLRKNEGINANLQAAWNQDGEESFEFQIIHEGPEWDNAKKRQDREEELINEYIANNIRVYNRYAGRKDLAPASSLAEYQANLKHKTPEYRQKMSELNTGRANLNRKGIWIDGQVFLSYLEAEENQQQKGSKAVTRKTLRAYVEDPLNSSFREATLEEITQEQERREAGGVIPTWVISSKKRSGLAKKVWVKGTVYDSVSAAARAEQISAQAMDKRLKLLTPGHYYLNEQNECFTKDNVGNVTIIPETVLNQYRVSDKNP